jgi:hypothetical protein
MASPHRPKIPQEMETQVLTRSLRRCCLCFALANDRSVKAGQIAHLDHNRKNNKFDNLVWMCFTHHDQYDGTTSQSKNFQLPEVKVYRDQMYEWLAEERRGASASDSVKELLKEAGLMLAPSEPLRAAPRQASGGVRTYIDGESHYLRCEQEWRRIHGPQAALDRLRRRGLADEKLVLVIPHAKVFWTRWLSPGQQAVYFTSVCESEQNKVGRTLREFGVIPDLMPEETRLAELRTRLLQEDRVIEKAKGRDAANFVRILGDAQSDTFDACNIYTSDISYVPVIRALQAMRKVVNVHGFRQGLGHDSELEYVPDKFVDLGQMILAECELVVTPGPAESGQ